MTSSRRTTTKKGTRSKAPVAKKRKVLRIGGIAVRRGEVRDILLSISDTYVGGTVSLPVRVIRAPKAGPRVFLTSAVHGDEINGTGILRELMYNQMPDLKAGSLICVPVVNVFGFETRVRYMPDRRDLNRCFPGSAHGSHASRVAETVFREIISQSDVGIDLHSAAAHRVNFPNIRADLGRKDVATLAKAFGCEVIVEGKGPVGSLRRAACEAGCPTIVLEAGQVGRIEPFAVECGVRGIRNVLRHLGMIGESEAPVQKQLLLRKTKWVRAEVGGLLRFHVAPGDLVTGGQPLATNEGVFGKARTTLISPGDAIVLSMTTHPAVKPGEPVCHLGYVAPATLKQFQKAISLTPPDDLFHRTRRDLASAIVVSDPQEPKNTRRRRRHG